MISFNSVRLGTDMIPILWIMKSRLRKVNDRPTVTQLICGRDLNPSLCDSGVHTLSLYGQVTWSQNDIAFKTWVPLMGCARQEGCGYQGRLRWWVSHLHIKLTWAQAPWGQRLEPPMLSTMLFLAFCLHITNSPKDLRLNAFMFL